MNYIAYYRVSTKKQDYGIEAQRNEVESHISKNNGTLLEEFSDKDSGKNDNRIGLQQAIKKCKEVGASLIIAKLDRFSRNGEFIVLMAKELKEAGVNFICLYPNINDTMTLFVFAGLAQQEREFISQRTKAGLEVARSKGKIIGRKRGIKMPHKEEVRVKIKENKKAIFIKHLEPHKNTILTIYKYTGSYYKTTKELNELGIPTIQGKQNWRYTQVKRAINLITQH